MFTMKTQLTNKLRMRLLLSAAILLTAGGVWGATTLWDEGINGTLDTYPFVPTNYHYVIHPIGTAADDTNYVRGSILIIPDGGNFTGYEDAFWFTVPTGRKLTGLFLVQTNTYTAFAWGSLYASTNGPWDGTGQIGSVFGWEAKSIPGPNDILALLGVSTNLPSGTYSINLMPTAGVKNGYLLHGPDTVHYELAIVTEPVIPSLEIIQIGWAMKISWSTNGTSSFVLQSTTNLSSISSWTSVTNWTSIAGGQFVVISPMLYDQQYFRLLRQ